MQFLIWSLVDKKLWLRFATWFYLLQVKNRKCADRIAKLDDISMIFFSLIHFALVLYIYIKLCLHFTLYMYRKLSLLFVFLFCFFIYFSSMLSIYGLTKFWLIKIAHSFPRERQASVPATAATTTSPGTPQHNPLTLHAMLFFCLNEFRKGLWAHVNALALFE